MRNLKNIIILLCFLLPIKSSAQMVSDTFGTPLTIGPTVTWGPITNLDSVKKIFVIYTEAQLAAKGILPGMTLYGVAWHKVTSTTLTPNVPSQFDVNLRIGGQYLRYDSFYFATNYPNYFYLTSMFASGFFNVGSYQNGLDLNIPLTPGWVTVMFKDSAIYTGGSLEVYSKWETTTPVSALTGSTSWSLDTTFVPGGLNINMHSSGSNYSNLGSTRPSLIIYHSGAPAACSGTPMGGGITGPADFCPGKNFTLFLSGASGGPGIAYQWQSAPSGSPVFTDIPGATLNNLITSMTQPTTYRCRVTCTNTNQFAYSGTFNVVFSALAQIDSVQQFPAGNGYTFLPFVQNSYPWLFQWHYGDGDSSTNVVGVHNYQNEGVYTVRLIVGNYCGYDTLYIPLTVGCPAAPNFQNVVTCSDDSLCPGESATLTMNGGMPVGYTVQWQSSVPPAAYADIPGATGPSIVASPSVTTKYRSRAVCTNSGGLRLSNETTVTVGQTSAGVITETHSGNTYTFTAAGAQYVSSYLWLFGDGNTSAAASPTHTYATNGNYMVQLIVSGNCTDTADAITTPVREVTANSGLITIYPNPFSDYLKVSSATAGRLTLIASDGRIVTSYRIDKGEATLRLPHDLPSGVYTGEFTTAQDGRKTVLKLVAVK